jgi:hypothetical protein
VRPKNSDNENEAEDRQTEFCFPSRVKRALLLEQEQYGGVHEPGNCPYPLESRKKFAKTNSAASSKTAASEQGKQSEDSKIDRKDWPQDKTTHTIPDVPLRPRVICAQFGDRDPDPIHKYQ